MDNTKNLIFYSLIFSTGNVIVQKAFQKMNLELPERKASFDRYQMNRPKFTTLPRSSFPTDLHAIRSHSYPTLGEDNKGKLNFRSWDPVKMESMHIVNDSTVNNGRQVILTETLALFQKQNS